MSSITSWTRLEPRVRDPGMRAGLAARIRDPLWMLSRQWQIGEFEGHDGGSAVQVLLETESTVLNWFHPGPLREADGSSGRPYNPTGTPLEVLVERERVRRPQVQNLDLAAEAGLHFLRLLAHNGVGEYGSRILRQYPLNASCESAQDCSPDRAATALWQVMPGRAPDGSALYQDLNPRFPGPQRSGDLPPDWGEIDGENDEHLLKAAVVDWLCWYDQLFSEPPDGESSWVNERLEYQFAVSAPASEGEHVLFASEYSEGHLDWYSFDHYPGHLLGAERAETEISSIAVVPTPVVSRGMPAARWWQIEDSSVDFGAVEAAPEDLTRLLWMQFALLHGSDWLIIPVELQVGSLAWIRSLVVADSFGEEVEVAPVGSNDPLAPRLFQLATREPDGCSPAEDPSAGEFQGLFLPPVLGPSLHSRPVEEVAFIRDDMANMAWAVEKIAESPSGRATDRQEIYDQRRGDEASSVVEAGEGAEVLYRLFSSVPPDHWIPLMPVRKPGTAGSSMQLQRGRVVRPGAHGQESPGAAQGCILREEPGVPLVLYDEQVPRYGVRVWRAFQYARWIDGSSHLWIGRRKNPGRGQGSSGLSFDVVEPASS